MWRILLTIYIVSVLIKTAVLITDGGFLKCNVFVQYIVYNARWGNNELQTML